MLSKSKFILGQQCVKSFWLDINNVEPSNPPDDGAKERLSAGNEVGEISKQLFSGVRKCHICLAKKKKCLKLLKSS